MVGLTDDQRTGWTVVVFVAVAITGAGLQSIGALLPTFESVFDVSAGKLGLLTPVGTIGFIGPLIIFGSLAGRLDIKWTVIGGLLATGVGFVLVGFSPTFIILLLFVGLQRAAVGVVRALDRPILSHLYPNNRGQMFSLETMAWATGAALGPFLVTEVLKVTTWRFVYFLLGFAALLLAVVGWRQSGLESVGSEQPLTRSNILPLLSESQILVMAVGLIFVGGIESAFFTWLPYYTTEFFDRSIANLSLSVYLFAYIPGRFLSSLAVKKSTPQNLVLISAGLLTLLLLIFFNTDGMAQTPYLTMVFLIGFVASALFPLLFTWGVNAMPRFTGPINAFAMVAAQIGFLVVPATIGLLAETYSIREAMLVQILLAGLLVTLMGSLRLFELE